MTLGNRLKSLRGTRTQQEIANILGISRARYSHYENNHVQPDNELLDKMAGIFNVTVDFLLGRKGVTNVDWTEQDEKLLKDFNSLSEDDQTYILGFIEKLKKSSQ